MTTVSPLRSPIPWIGGKYYSAPRIVKAFPAPDRYDVFVDLFGGAAHILLAKPPFKHVEVYNDMNGDLVNFWMHCRDHAQALEERCRSLPYSRELYYQYHARLYSGEVLEPLERAVLWFYMMRSSFIGQERKSPPGWSTGTRNLGQCDAHAYRIAVTLFPVLQQRLQYVLIDHRNFTQVLSSYHKPRVLIYADPPYLEAESYYQHLFTLADHERLAELLNATPAYVALSYYPHSLLEQWYPSPKWRRISWQVPKHSQRTKAHREQATELLLCNYEAPMASLWEEDAIDI